jgi:hypothetical protein
MSTKSWPKIKAVMKNGKPMVMVDARIAGKGAPVLSNQA